MLESLVQPWATELGDNPELQFMKGTTVNAVSLGITNKDFFENLSKERKKAVQEHGATLIFSPSAYEDAADVVGFLAGGQSKCVTGSVVAATAVATFSEQDTSA